MLTFIFQWTQLFQCCIQNNNLLSFAERCNTLFTSADAAKPADSPNITTDGEEPTVNTHGTTCDLTGSETQPLLDLVLPCDRLLSYPSYFTKITEKTGISKLLMQKFTPYIQNYIIKYKTRKRQTKNPHNILLFMCVPLFKHSAPCQTGCYVWVQQVLRWLPPSCGGTSCCGGATSSPDRFAVRISTGRSGKVKSHAYESFP